MATVKIHYEDKAARGLLLHALYALLDDIEPEPIFVCIGTDRHILDCFGPLTGTMLQAKAPDIPIYGTLNKPLHAQNLLPGLKELRQDHLERVIVAIDASVGGEEEIGSIQLRTGGLVPGKAFSKNLPTVGQYAITGVVDLRVNHWGARKSKNHGLALVYQMAQLLSESIAEWHRNKHRS
jgi:putative sporulation protein YyaC